MTIDLRRAILDEPESIGALANALDIPTIGYVPPTLYTEWNPKRFDAGVAEENLEAIKAICDGADWIVTDLEKEPRRIVRDPDDYEPPQVRWAVGQFKKEMWAWFRKRWPESKRSEFNLANAKDLGDMPLAESLVEEYLDAVDVAMYWTPHPNHTRRSEKILEHAKLRASVINKPLITWIWDRYKVLLNENTYEYRPLSNHALEEMLGRALSAGVDIAVLWSNTYQIYNAGDGKRVLTEDINGLGESVINANMARVMSAMRLAAEVENG